MSKSRKVQIEQLIEFFQYRKFLKSVAREESPGFDAGDESIFGDDGAEYQTGASSIMVCNPTQVAAEIDTKMF